MWSKDRHFRRAISAYVHARGRSVKLIQLADVATRSLQCLELLGSVIHRLRLQTILSLVRSKLMGLHRPSRDSDHFLKMSLEESQEQYRQYEGLGCEYMLEIDAPMRIADKMMST